MADEPKPNETSTEKPPESLAAPSPGEAYAVGRAEGLAQLNQQLTNELARDRQAQAQPRQQPGPDPFAVYAKDDVMLNPGQKHALLDAGVRGRAAQVTGQAMQYMDQRVDQKLAGLEADMALNLVKQNNPELLKPENESKFKAMMVMVNDEAQKKGTPLSSLDIAQRAAGEYSRLFGGSKPNPTPYVEGSGRPDMAGGNQPQPQEVVPEYIKRSFGKLVGIMQPNTGDPEQMNQLTRDYVKSRNKRLFDGGFNTDSTVIAETVQEGS